MINESETDCSSKEGNTPVNNTPSTGLNAYFYFNDSLETNVHTEKKIQISEHELQKLKT